MCGWLFSFWFCLGFLCLSLVLSCVGFSVFVWVFGGGVGVGGGAQRGWRDQRELYMKTGAAHVEVGGDGRWSRVRSRKKHIERGICEVSFIISVKNLHERRIQLPGRSVAFSVSTAGTMDSSTSSQGGGGDGEGAEGKGRGTLRVGSQNFSGFNRAVYSAVYSAISYYPRRAKNPKTLVSCASNSSLTARAAPQERVLRVDYVSLSLTHRFTRRERAVERTVDRAGNEKLRSIVRSIVRSIEKRGICEVSSKISVKSLHERTTPPIELCDIGVHNTLVVNAVPIPDSARHRHDIATVSNRRSSNYSTARALRRSPRTYRQHYG